MTRIQDTQMYEEAIEALRRMAYDGVGEMELTRHAITFAAFIGVRPLQLLDDAIKRGQYHPK